MVEGPVHSAFWHDERLVVVEGIPALVCRRCGEQFYDDATAIRLDLLRGSGFPVERARRVIEVPVFAYAGDDASSRDVVHGATEHADDRATP